MVQSCIYNTEPAKTLNCRGQLLVDIKKNRYIRLNSVSDKTKIEYTESKNENKSKLQNWHIQQ